MKISASSPVTSLIGPRDKTPHYAICFVLVFSLPVFYLQTAITFVASSHFISNLSLEHVVSSEITDRKISPVFEHSCKAYLTEDRAQIPLCRLNAWTESHMEGFIFAASRSFCISQPSTTTARNHSVFTKGRHREVHNRG